MKIIKKLCIPLLSLVLVLGCFSVSQMDASAAMSANDHIGPGYNQGGGDRIRPSDIRYTGEIVNVVCMAYLGDIGLCGCSVYRGAILTHPDDYPNGVSLLCENCGHSFHAHHHAGGGGGSHVPSHTHNYSTTWGAWRKISSCRFPG